MVNTDSTSISAKETEFNFDFRKFNPNAFHLFAALRDPTLRMIILYGGSSSSKSYSVAQVLLVLTLIEGENSLVMRKVGASISRTIYSDFKAAASELGMSDMFRFQLNTIKCLVNDCKIDFTGLDDPEKIKGISQYKRVFLDELSEYVSQDLKQIRKRLRGKKGQQIIGAFNPISIMHWIKRELLDVEQWHDVPMTIEIDGVQVPEELCKVKSLKKNAPKMLMNARTLELEQHEPDMLLIQSTYLNNFWVVGSPNGKYGYYDEQCIADFEKDRINDPDYYNVYALGEWGIIHTGSEFFSSFRSVELCGTNKYNPELPLHLTMDSNVLPYISCGMWQIDYVNGVHLHQVGELAIESPNNSARKSAKVIAKRLRSMGYSDIVYLHGDASGKAANTIDDNNRSFFDLVIDTLNSEGFKVEDKIGDKNPSVPISGEFINSIFDGNVSGVSIGIDSKCTVSIEDYQAVQKDANGAILKTKIRNSVTKQSYEEHGHFSDTFRYVVVDLLSKEFTEFSLRRKRNLYGEKSELRFYNPNNDFSYDKSLSYVMPDIDGMLVMATVKHLGNDWHITQACVKDLCSSSQIAELIGSVETERFMFDCPSAYFPIVRELRKTKNVDVVKQGIITDDTITATSDYVKAHFLINPAYVNSNEEYAMFIDDVMDYNPDSKRKGASLVLAGLARKIMRDY